jgi:hypothetical protein
MKTGESGGGRVRCGVAVAIAGIDAWAQAAGTDRPTTCTRRRVVGGFWSDPAQVVHAAAARAWTTRRPLIWTHVVADVLIAAAYYSIPIALVYFVRRRRDLSFKTGSSSSSRSSSWRAGRRTSLACSRSGTRSTRSTGW